MQPTMVVMMPVSRRRGLHPVWTKGLAQRGSLCHRGMGGLASYGRRISRFCRDGCRGVGDFGRHARTAELASGTEMIVEERMTIAVETGWLVVWADGRWMLPSPSWLL